MRIRATVFLTPACLSGMAFAAVEPALPSWNDGERKALESKGWVAGSLLLTDEPVPNEPAQADAKKIDVAQPTPEEIAESETRPNEIPEKYWPDYFGDHPKNFLVDPQKLLGSSEYRDRLGFLNYHASDSSIDLYVYVFKGDQEIPGEVREEELVERFFSKGRPAAVVYYFMGAPQRSVLYLSPSLTDVVAPAEQRRALESSMMQAFGKLDQAGQIEAFLVQMSIRIYWMERMMGGESAASDEAPALLHAAKPVEKKSAIMEKLKSVLESAKRFVFPAALLAGVAMLGLAVTSWTRRRARYQFPDFDVEPRLGGAHAAGVGAVISFASAAVPPASQRDQVPDYLRRA